jgi:hypothetical protein
MEFAGVAIFVTALVVFFNIEVDFSTHRVRFVRIASNPFSRSVLFTHSPPSLIILWTNIKHMGHMNVCQTEYLTPS